MTVRHFCTLFDSGYLLKGLAMIRSLQKWSPGAQIHVLCMNEKARAILEQLAIPGVDCISLTEIETPELLEAKKDRGLAESCWTLSPCLPGYVLDRHPEIEFITYLDSDLYFYSSLDPLFEEIGQNSVAVIEHRFSPRLKDREVNGRFCVEWVSFRRDTEGMACLARWRAQYIEWCHYRLEGNRMGDQKYLDEWPGLYPHCHIIEHLGAGVAPWNFSQYDFGKGDFGPTVDGQPLIFYHFHQFSLLADGRFDRLSSFYTLERAEPDAVYSAYEAALSSALTEVRLVDPTFSDGLRPADSVARLRWAQAFLPAPVKMLVKKVMDYRI